MGAILALGILGCMAFWVHEINVMLFGVRHDFVTDEAKTTAPFHQPELAILPPKIKVA